MNHLSKSIFVVVVLLVLAGCAGRVGKSTDSAQIVEKTAVLIADFTPPPSYEPEFGLHAIGYTVVAYNSGDSGGHLYLVQAGERPVPQCPLIAEQGKLLLYGARATR